MKNKKRTPMKYSKAWYEANKKTPNKSAIKAIGGLLIYTGCLLILVSQISILQFIIVVAACASTSYGTSSWIYYKRETAQNKELTGEKQ